MIMNKSSVVALLVGKGLLGASLVVGFGSMPTAAADGETVQLRTPVHQTGEVDYMSDGSRFVSDDTGESDSHQVLDPQTHQWRDVTESDTEWSCVDDGNRVCGPQNAEGKPAACYDQGGVIVAVWPCQSTVNADGSQDVDTDADDAPSHGLVTLAAFDASDKHHSPKH